MSRDRVRVLVGVVLTLALVGPVAWLWWGSRLPASYSAMDMGTLDYGGGQRSSPEHREQKMRMGASAVSVRDLDTVENRKPDVVVDLAAR